MPKIKFTQHKHMTSHYGPATFTKSGDIKEVSEKVAMALLSDFPNMFSLVPEEAIPDETISEDDMDLLDCITPSPQAMTQIADNLNVDFHTLIHPLNGLINKKIVGRKFINGKNKYFLLSKEEE